MGQQDIQLRIDGETCRAYVMSPPGGAAERAVILYHDGFGIRPTILAMGQRLADDGYLVLAPDLFFRAGAYDPVDPAAVLASADPGAILRPRTSTTNPRRAARDSEAFLAYLSTRRDVSEPGVATIGYSLGGAVSLTVAGSYPDRIVAAASFHGVQLGDDSETSAHLLAPAIQARVYVAAAETDPFCSPEALARLSGALNRSGVRNQVEVYPGVHHGWTLADVPYYDHSAAEQHWERTFGLLAATRA